MQIALREETAIEGNRDGRRPTDWHAENVYPPDPRWGGRFAPEVTHHTEHVVWAARAGAHTGPFKSARTYTINRVAMADRSGSLLVRGQRQGLFDVAEAEGV